MVYLIHIMEPLGNETHSACHYLGLVTATRNLERRILEHLAGTPKKGARILAAANERGIPWHIVRLWPHGDGVLERRLKNRKAAHKICPVCNPGGWQKNGNYQQYNYLTIQKDYGKPQPHCDH